MRRLGQHNTGLRGGSAGISVSGLGACWRRQAMRMALVICTLASLTAVERLGDGGLAAAAGHGSGGGLRAELSVGLPVVDMTVGRVATWDNAPPQAVDDRIRVSGLDTLAIAQAELLANDGDADGEPLLIVAVQAVVGGMPVAGDPITLLPEPDPADPVLRFGYVLRDSDGATATGFVDIVLTDLRRVLLDLRRPGGASLDVGLEAQVSAGRLLGAPVDQVPSHLLLPSASDLVSGFPVPGDG